ncbi:TM2 domain-containing protein [Kaistia defluvii]|uniref:TM2 domain-containing protein n=1 Tax=Kaistia defluvii TaxID=410841 RepID=UPI0022592946|nr:TM2 domain-containing protein [Kaistia defluvii]MCX5517118.1 TM2 domain-containing protein [Kaistia defluvii]
MPLTTEQQMLIEMRVANESPSTATAYLLWLFLWFVSAHRFYLGRPGTAILQILSYFILIGFIWVLIDAFLIPGMIRERQNEIRQRMMAGMF